MRRPTRKLDRNQTAIAKVAPKKEQQPSLTTRLASQIAIQLQRLGLNSDSPEVLKVVEWAEGKTGEVYCDWADMPDAILAEFLNRLKAKPTPAQGSTEGFKVGDRVILKNLWGVLSLYPKLTLAKQCAVWEVIEITPDGWIVAKFGLDRLSFDPNWLHVLEPA